MFCSMCGAENANDGNFCLKCGAALQGQKGIPAPGASFDQPPPAFAGPTQTSGKAIGSLICGLFFFALPVAVVAVVLGHLSLSDIRKAGGRLKGHGLAVAGLVLGYGGIAVIPIVLIIAAIAIPNLLRAKTAANEAAAVGSLRTINTAAINYYTTFSNNYPPSLDAMGGSTNGNGDCNHAELIDAALASGLKRGYVFSYGAGQAGGLSPTAAAAGCTSAGAATYGVNADPVTRGTTGLRSFYTDQTGVIRFETQQPATEASPPLE